MAEPLRSLLSRQIGQAITALKDGWRILRLRGPSQIQFWFIALVIGIAAGGAAVIFRLGITALQSALYGVDNIRMLHSFAESLAWYHVLIIPIMGGLVVGHQGNISPTQIEPDSRLALGC